MTTETMRLCKSLSHATNTTAHIGFWRYRFKVTGVLTRSIAAQMVSMLRRPLSIGKKQRNPVGSFGLVSVLHPDIPIASGVFVRQPRPALIRAALINFRPVALFETLGDRALPHGYSVTHWYE